MKRPANDDINPGARKRHAPDAPATVPRPCTTAAMYDPRTTPPSNPFYDPSLDQYLGLHANAGYDASFDQYLGLPGPDRR
ncbi:MAG: hypothetical protein ACRYGA_14065 [Janthinobacterium lividum]